MQQFLGCSCQPLQKASCHHNASAFSNGKGKLLLAGKLEFDFIASIRCNSGIPAMARTGKGVLSSLQTQSGDSLCPPFAAVSISCTMSPVPVTVSLLVISDQSVDVLCVPPCSGHHILYHEPCAVYSNGTGQIPMGGMEDDQVLRFYEHGERCMGKGLKCCLCGQK
jgi:hypothetical protein